ncbi:MAG TPA: 5'/3'-nucleotidase SurE [Candidatus Hydrogenedentes bacterium]|nr:5'/3'-nucleotidase SurE [Candidatus Hydrogenedentota bacterium]HOL77337.1 5'/3'-nucleotidase SurE [Candidatus Hydrogenedentota bacterium]HPO84845.1 5'/3'-nucleotidase SurE [Candidatus Hydrogenedentota bacterium]
MSAPLILVTNDDGIYSAGIAELAKMLEPYGEVWVYAPDREQSAVGHGVSLHRPLRVTQVGERQYMVDGTPTDCVMLAVRSLLPRRPDLVVSGINAGPNLGDDVTYSGTVAGAYEGMLLGVDSFAISVVSRQPRHLTTAGVVAAKMAAVILREGLPTDTVLNVNVPDLPLSSVRGIRITRMGKRDYQDEIISREDPRGVRYYWIGGAAPSHVREIGTDFDAIEHDCISVTPLHRDITHYDVLDQLRGLFNGLTIGETL